MSARFAVPIPRNDVDPGAVWYGNPPAEPPDMEIASDAVPLNDAVIVPAEKFPDESRSTAVVGVFADTIL